MTQRVARKKLSRDVREAACLLQIRKGDGWLIPEPLRSSGDARAIIAFVQYDHATPHALTQDDRPQNLAPMGRADHAVKTTKRDVPELARTKRIEKAEAAFRARLAARTSGSEPVAAKPKPKSTIKSRGFAGSKKFDGSVTWKDKR